MRNENYFIIFFLSIITFLGLYLIILNVDDISFIKEMYLFFFLLIVSGIGLFTILTNQKLGYLIFSLFFATVLFNVLYLFSTQPIGVFNPIIIIIIVCLGFFMSIQNIKTIKRNKIPRTELVYSDLYPKNGYKEDTEGYFSDENFNNNIEPINENIFVDSPINNFGKTDVKLNVAKKNKSIKNKSIKNKPIKKKSVGKVSNQSKKLKKKPESKKPKTTKKGKTSVKKTKTEIKFKLRKDNKKPKQKINKTKSKKPIQKKKNKSKIKSDKSKLNSTKSTSNKNKTKKPAKKSQSKRARAR